MPLLTVLRILLLSLILLGSQAYAKEEWEASIPDALTEWLPWVLKDHEAQNCPFVYNHHKIHYCQWPTEIQLQLNGKGGRFEQKVLLHDEDWVRLPGEVGQWPQDVMIGSEAAMVTERDNLPFIHLEKGKYTISGRFLWEEMPERFQLVPNTAIVSIALNDKAVDFPNIDRQGYFWIKKTTPQEISQADHLNVKVFRKLTDTIPFTVTTQFTLNVSGKNREVLLPGALLPDFTVKQLNSPLESKVEKDGALRVKLRPGVWTIDIVGYHANPVKALSLPKFTSPMPVEEIWVFDAQNALRVVDVKNVQAIDPRQTNLPQQWQHLPSYYMPAKSVMKLEEKQRGDSENQPDMLQLQRDLWLDFDGKGYTVKDHINGSIHQSSRLEVQPAMSLGRVSIDGQDQFITTVEGGHAGVEVKKGNISLRSDGRIDNAKGAFNAVGWLHDFKKVSAQLFLPPGWRLFAATGVDKATPSWVNHWTLFDVFLVMFVTMAMVKLLGVKTGVFGLIALILVHNELPAFSWTALIILAMIALESVLPQSWFKKAVMFVKRAALLGLILLTLPFMLMHMRDAIHPQLKGFSYSDSYSRDYIGSGTSYKKQRYQEESMSAEMDSLTIPAPPPSLIPGTKTAGRIAGNAMQRVEKFKGFYQYDPGAMVQTGFGVANWRGETVSLRWNGPVDHQQEVSLWLLSPAMNLVLASLRVIALCVFIAFLLQVPSMSFSSLFSRFTMRSFALLLIGGLVCLPSVSQAEDTPFPPDAMLKELRNYAIISMEEAPECLPQCATISRATLAVDHENMTVRMDVLMSEHAAIPLPSGNNQWQVKDVLVDNQAASGLRLHGNAIWLSLEKGRHTVLLQGKLPERDNLSVRFALKPHYVEASAKGWDVFGIHQNQVKSGNVQLVRIKAANVEEETDELEQTVIPPLVRVERVISLGTTWEVTTHVYKQVPADNAFVINVPLLKGESVTSAGMHVKNKAMEVNMPANVSSVMWQSVLKPTPQLVLQASDHPSIIELWRLQTTNLWHVEAVGIPKIHATSAIPQWQPWPGEKVTFTITKPQGVEGPHKTIDKVSWKLDVGQRSLDAHIEFILRSSRGDQHSITLPEGAVLQSLLINNRTQPIQQNGREVTFALSPGSQTIVLSWKQPVGIDTLFTVPEINLNLPSVNVETTVTLPRDRWALFTGGSLVGPAVLFWGVFPVLVLLSLVLGAVKFTPLKWYHWLLLLIGLSQTNIAVNIIVVGWFLVMGWRQRSQLKGSYGWFDTRQIVLGLWTVAALFSVFIAIQQGLLGSPNMKITGNGSHAYYLRWYQDIAEAVLPQPWVFSVPVLIYRGLMLLWALWLAFAFTGWLKWAWTCFSQYDLWRKKPKAEKKSVESDNKSQDKAEKEGFEGEGL